MIGEIISERYRIEQRIGEGATAFVYRAVDTRLNRTVALKMLLPEVPDATRQRFAREANSSAHLNHPGIMAIYDVGQDEAINYIVMEYIDGTPLSNYIPAKPDLVAELGQQICLALDYAHRMGIIHRDIKPANIYVTAGDKIKIMDFGLAIPIEGHKRITEMGRVMGTPTYLSPEQAMGETLTPLSDLYSVGVVLYEMVTGQLPFDADDIPAILFQHVHKPPVPPSEFVPNMPLWLEYTILKALEKDPQKRFKDGAAMAAALAGNVSDSELKSLRLTTPNLVVDMCVDLETRAEELGQAIPSEPFALPVAIASNAIRQILHRTGRISKHQSPNALEAVNIYQQLASMYFVANKFERLAYVTLRSVNLAERSAPSRELALSYTEASIMNRISRLKRLGILYARKACQIAQQLGDPATAAYVLLGTYPYLNQVKEWGELANTLRHPRLSGTNPESIRNDSDVMLALVYYLVGNFTEAEHILGAVQAPEQTTPDRQVWRMCGQIIALLRLGRTEEATDLLHPLYRLRNEKLGRIAKLSYHAARAQVFMQHNQLDVARVEADIAARYVADILVTSFSTVEVFNAIGEVYVAQWEMCGDSHDPVARLARQWVVTMFDYAALHPIGQPRAWLVQGRIDWLSGKQQRARQSWHKSIAAAKRLGMPYEEARAYYEIGRHLTVDNPERNKLLKQASDIFSRLNTAYDLELTRQATLVTA